MTIVLTFTLKCMSLTSQLVSESKGGVAERALTSQIQFSEIVGDMQDVLIGGSPFAETPVRR